MNQDTTSQSYFLRDRITWLAILIVACFVSVLMLSSQSRASYPTYILAVLMLVTAPAWKDVWNLRMTAWFLALFAWLGSSVFWSEQFELREAVSVWSRALLTFFFVVAFAECQLRGQLQKWMGIALTAVGSVAVAAAVVNFYLTDPADGRLNGLGQLDTHVVAALVYGAVMLFVMRTLWQSSGLLARGVLFAVLILIAFAVMLSDSRNAWVSVSIGVLVFVLACLCRDKLQFAATLVALSVLFGVVLMALGLGESTQELVFPRGDSFRVTIWTTTLERITEDSVLFGRGILTNDDVTAGGITFPHPHNMYLAVLHQGGLVALFLYGGLLIQVLRVLMENFESLDAKLALSILLMALGSHLLDGHELIDKVGDTWLLIWLPVGVAMGFQLKPGGR